MNATYPKLDYTHGKGLKMIPKPRVEQGIKRDVKFEDDILGTITLSVLNVYFGLLDGFINSIPTSDLL